VTFEELIEQKRGYVERTIREVARNRHLSSAEFEEFRAAVDRALHRNDYELLKAFEGRSTWETYLETVILREYFQFQVAMWGDWRPSALAVRQGAVAMLLEELVVRNRFRVIDAIDWMRTTHHVDWPRHKLLELADALRLTGEPGRRPGLLDGLPPNAELRNALREAIATLSPDDRLIVSLRFRDHQPLTRIATVVKIPVRALQRQIETIKAAIRVELIARGIAASDVETVLRSSDTESTAPQQQWWDLVMTRPSKESKL
jgi:hypothetical protein